MRKNHSMRLSSSCQALTRTVSHPCHLHGPAYQASNLARQTLSLLAGDTIDRFLMVQLKSLTSELRLARLILSLNSMLWPGGVWFAWANQQTQQRAEAAKRQQPSQQQTAQQPPQPSTAWTPTWTPAPPMAAERFLTPAVRPPDEAQTAAKVWGS